MQKHRKTWNKSKIRVTIVGDCKYCNEEILNTDSFVSFYPKGHAHYQCMRKTDDDKTYGNEI